MLLQPFRGVMIVAHSILMMATFAVSYAYFAGEVGQELSFEIPQLLYPVVGIGVIGISVITALFHVVGGGIMGATAGGVLMGMKMGFFLGLAYALGRLWLYAGAAFGASILFWPEVQWSTIGLGVSTVVCLVIQKVTTFVWSKVDGQ